MRCIGRIQLHSEASGPVHFLDAADAALAARFARQAGGLQGIAAAYDTEHRTVAIAALQRMAYRCRVAAVRECGRRGFAEAPALPQKGLLRHQNK